MTDAWPTPGAGWAPGIFTDAAEERDRALREAVLGSYDPAMVARVMEQDYCELDCDFLGFLHVYYAAFLLASPQTTVIDFGCYLAAQAVMFQGCREYIGVDTVDMARFETANTRHVIGTIQDFIAGNPQFLRRPDVLAVCSYVPDDAARRLVNASFLNVVNVYPHSGGFRPSVLG